MTPRNRVLAALHHEQPDRMPVDLSGHRSSGIAAIAYAKLRDYLGLEKRPIRVYDVQQQLAIVDDDVLDRFGVDTIEMGRGFALDDSDWADWVLPDGTPCQLPAWVQPEREANRWVIRAPSGRVIADMPDGALYFEQAYYPFAERDDLDSLPEALEESMWTGIASPPGPLVQGPDGNRNLRDGAAADVPAPIERSSACSAATCLRWGSFFIGTTISSCCSPASRNVRMRFSIESSRCIWPISIGS